MGSALDLDAKRAGDRDIERSRDSGSGGLEIYQKDFGNPTPTLGPYNYHMLVIGSSFRLLGYQNPLMLGLADV